MSSSRTNLEDEFLRGGVGLLKVLGITPLDNEVTPIFHLRYCSILEIRLLL